MIGWLLRVKFLIWKNALLRGSRSAKLRSLVWYGIAAYVFVFTLFLARDLFSLLSLQAPALAPAVLSAIFSGLMTFVLFWGLGTLMTQLYLASDLELLLAAPLRRRQVFIVKVLEGMWSALTPASFGLAALIGFGLAHRASVFYYAWAVMALAAILALIVGISMAVVMIVMRLVPARRARDLLMVVWVAVFVSVWLLTMQMTRGGSVAQQLAANQTMLAGIGQRAGWLPAGWAAASLGALVAGDWPAFAGRAALLLAATGAMLALAYALYDRTFYRAWVMLHETPARRRAVGAARPARRLSLPGLLRGLPWPAGEIAAKDWTLLPRDLRWLTGLIMPIVVAGFYVYGLRSSGGAPNDVQEPAFWLSCLVAPLVAWLFSLSVCVPALAGEGRNIALLRSAPLRAGNILWGKVATTAPLVSLVTALATALAAAFLGAAGGSIAVAAGQALVLGMAFSVAGVAAGGITPNYRAEHMRRAGGVAGSYALLILGAAITVGHVALLGALIANLAPASAAGASLAQLAVDALRGVVFSPLSLAIALLLYGLAIGLVIAAWEYSRRRLERWQIDED